MADERLTLRQAALRLGVSESAVRKRVERGTLRSDKGPDGRRYVYLEDSPGADNLADTGADTGADASATHERDALIPELRSHNDTLRGQLEAERQAHAEARRIIAGLVERIPAIEAPQEETRESPQTGEGEPEGAEPRPDTPGTPEGSQRRSWWVAALLGLLLIVSVASLSFFVFLASG